MLYPLDTELELRLGPESEFLHPVGLVGDPGEVGEGHAAVAGDGDDGAVFGGPDPLNLAEAGLLLLHALLLSQGVEVGVPLVGAAGGNLDKIVAHCEWHMELFT